MDSASEQKRLYDAACKQVLSERGIVAHILKTCVAEFSQVSIADIRDKYICGNPETAVESVHVEDNSLAEGTIKYDVRFLAKAPKDDKLIKLIINIEAQNNFNPGYPLHKRATYYCGRMISSQYGTVFTKSHYEKIQKVYSIWICTKPNKDWEYSINRYSVNEERLLGTNEAAKDDYDLMTYVMVCLGKNNGKSVMTLLELLNYVMLDRESFAAKRDKLLETFDVQMTPHLEKGVATMCNLSEGLIEEGYEKGLSTVAMNMLRLNKTVAEIATIVGWSLDKVRKLAQDNNIPITE